MPSAVVGRRHFTGNLFEYYGTALPAGDCACRDEPGDGGFPSSVVFEDSLAMCSGASRVQQRVISQCGGGSPSLSALETYHGTIDNGGIPVRNHPFRRPTCLFTLDQECVYDQGEGIHRTGF